MDEQDIYREIGRRIREFRKATGQTQDQLAIQIGLSRASVANIEAGRQHFLLYYVYSIADALDLDTPVSLLPGPHESTISPADKARVPVPRKGLTDKQREEVIQLMSGDTGDHESDTTGGK